MILTINVKKENEHSVELFKAQCAKNNVSMSSVLADLINFSLYNTDKIESPANLISVKLGKLQVKLNEVNQEQQDIAKSIQALRTPPPPPVINNKLYTVGGEYYTYDELIGNGWTTEEIENLPSVIQ